VRPVGERGPAEPPALTYGDAEALRAGLGFVRAFAPVRALPASVLLPSERVSVRVIGTTADYFEMRRLRFQRGRAFDADEVSRGEPVCVLGAEAAKRLLPSGDPYAALVKVAGNWYRVIGILQAASSSAEPSGDGDSTRQVYLPITNTFAADAARRQSLAEAWLAIDSGTDPEAAARVVERALERRHDGKQHFEVETAARLLAEHRAARSLLNQLLLGVAAISFLLGGFGMMSASFQNVRARRREIAIRRAVGAQRHEVLAQFLLEGCVLALAGALVGLVVGWAGSAAAAVAGGWPWMLAPGQSLLALAIALAVAVASTLHPAYRAASLDPVEALRFEA
jgi:putative ABC transport system permease protein